MILQLKRSTVDRGAAMEIRMVLRGRLSLRSDARSATAATSVNQLLVADESRSAQTRVPDGPIGARSCRALTNAAAGERSARQLSIAA